MSAFISISSLLALFLMSECIWWLCSAEQQALAASRMSREASKAPASGNGVCSPHDYVMPCESILSSWLNRARPVFAARNIKPTNLHERASPQAHLCTICFMFLSGADLCLA